MAGTPLSWAGGFGHYGTSKGVIYPSNGAGVAWSGLTEVEIAYDGGDVNATPADNLAAWITTSASKSLTPTLHALDYPDALLAMLGEKALNAAGSGGTSPVTTVYDLQTPTTGSFAFLTERMGRGSDQGEEKSDIVVMYNLRLAPAERDLTTGSDDMVEFQFDATSSPIEFTHEGKPTSTSMLTIRAEDANYDKALADLLEGKLITPDVYLAYTSAP